MYHTNNIKKNNNNSNKLTIADHPCTFLCLIAFGNCTCICLVRKYVCNAIRVSMMIDVSFLSVFGYHILTVLFMK